jgi:transcriptional regulator with XRE-family HTH domain
MQGSSFKERLDQEFSRRQARNPRYSLRGFARLLGTDHSTLSQILRGARRPPVSQIRTWAEKLGITREEAAIYVAAERIPHAARETQEGLRQWILQATCLVTDPTHREILRLTHEPEFQADSRWIAEQAGVGIDQVNMAFDRLLRMGLVEAGPSRKWRDVAGLGNLTCAEFRKLAIARVEEMAAAARVDLHLSD